MKKILLVLGILSILVTAGCNTIRNSNSVTLNVGDCVDITGYDDALSNNMASSPKTTRYCKIAGNIQLISEQGKFPIEYAFDLQQPCVRLICNFDVALNPELVPRSCLTQPLDGANNIDGRIVSKSLCY